MATPVISGVEPAVTKVQQEATEVGKQSLRDKVKETAKKLFKDAESLVLWSGAAYIFLTIVQAAVANPITALALGLLGFGCYEKRTGLKTLALVGGSVYLLASGAQAALAWSVAAVVIAATVFTVGKNREAIVKTIKGYWNKMVGYTIEVKKTPESTVSPVLIPPVTEKASAK